MAGGRCVVTPGVTLGRLDEVKQWLCCLSSGEERGGELHGESSSSL